MNNIYKVIWSKAKNCYVVASEIARSHTKSATGSEKIGGVTRRSILASLVALSLLCGGFGVATAADGSVHVEDIASTATSKEVYTAGKVDTLLADYGKKTDVETNKNDIATLNTTTTNQGNQITANTTNIANNTAAIAKKADVTALGEYAKTVDVNTELAKKADAANVYTKTEADTKLADYAKTADVNTALAGKADKATTLAGYGINDAYTKGEVDNALNNKADKATTLAGYGIADAYTKGEVDNALNDKADKATTLAGYGITDAYTKAEVNTAVANAVTTAGNNVDTKLADYAKTTDVYNKAEVDGKITAEANARNNAITAAIAQERNDRDGAINTAINGEVTNRNQAIDNAIAQEVTDRNAAVTNAKAELQAKITAEETARTNADTAFNTRLTTAEGKIGANETAIGELKAKDTELEGKITTLEGSGVKYDTAVKDKITLAGAGGTTITNLKDAALNESSTDAVTGKQLNKTNENLAAEETARTTKDAELEGKITKNSQDITKLKEKDIELEGNIQTNANNIQANADAITATNKRTAGIKRNDATNETTIEGNVTVDNLGNVKAKGDVTADGKLTGKGVDAGAGDITTTGAVNTGSLKVENASQLKGDVTMDKTLSVTGDTKLKKTDVDGTLNVTGESSLKNTKVDGTLTTTGKATFKEAVEMDKGLTVTNGATTLKGTTVDGALNVTGESSLKNTQVDGTLSVNKETTLNGTLTAKGEAKFEKNVTIEKDLTVNGKLNVGEIAMENKKTDADGTIHNSSTTITADGITHHGEVKKSGVTTESQFTHTEKGSETYAKKGDTTDWTETRSDVTADGVKTEARDSKGNRTNASQTAKDINGNVTDKDGNKTDMKVTATENSIQIQDKDGKNTNLQVNTKDSSVTEITNAAGATTKTEQTAKDITNIAEQGTIKNDAMNIENNASGNIKNTSQNGTITNDAKDIVNNATGDMTNTVGGKLTTTVTGQATGNFNGGLDTNVTGTENHTVTGDQNIHVTGKQTNKIDGDQENIIGGNQTTTVTGDISNKAENITNEANTKLTDKVGDNTRVLDSEGITDTVPGADGKGSTFKQRIDAIMGNVKTDAGESEVTQKGDEITSVVGKGEATNSRVTQKKNLLETAVTDGTNYNISNDIANASAKELTDGTKVNKLQDNLDSSEKTITNGTYKTSKLQTALDITNTAKDGTITNDAKDIVNNASGDMTNTVGGKLTTTVTGQATENFNGGLDTNVTGTENHTVNGKQINTIKNGQENIISGGQTNTITGGQINNITGDQTTTITGNKKETVTENVTEDYQKDLTTTVGGNENHEVKGTKTETVEGKVTENYKAGQATNVTGDQDITVSGTQTTTATDINRNASSGMIDTIDNDYGTNTETKVAGKTTTDVSIKGTGEKGQYIRGANESRDYLIKGTLKNSETKTAEATSTEITDGNGKTSSTIQDKTQISGSVTNGTSSAVSNVKADSIDTAVIEGTNTSLISQKKDSITSVVGNGTTSTVIQQGDKDITIASNGGTVGIVGKDIINNATNEITNTAGTKITDKVGNNTRVIDQTSITDTVGTASRKIEDGKITDTAGDSTVTTENGKGTTFAKAGSAAYSTEAGAPTDTNIAGNHITTGRVDANELGVSDKDDQGNTADFSVKAGEGIKGSATDKDGNKTYTKVTATENSFQVQDKDGNIKNHQVNTKDKSENTIKNGDKTNIVTSTADGTTFNNSKANTAFEGGTYTDTTIKGNTITTGKVTMDYADVMKDLGVHGNANIAGKTTTGSLEVKGESKLTGDVTMESNATVKKDLTVEGNTNLKNTKVDGTLDVTQKATFGDSVSIAKDLSVDGNATIKGDVTAKSYKVGDKTYISAAGINANDQKITNVADGSISEGSKDAVNGGQLYTVKNDLEGKVNKVGANAAAMANLHPMEFDPDSKWNIAAAIGNYGSETAAALGAFYRPNDDVMVNLSTAFGTGENMVGGGVSVRLGKGGNKLSREENNALKDQVDNLTARMDALLSVLNPNMSKDFPDVPENHWAYEAVSRLAGNDIVQGYPDGEFHGERTMTRYEMAEIIYNALSRGAEAEKELVEEFKPELQAMAASEKATAEKSEG